MKTYIVDAFTDRPLSGNPAGVCLVEAFPAEQTMLAIAQELALSETAFVAPTTPTTTSEGPNSFRIRYFSPVMEIPLCGHATLGSACVMQKERGLKDLQFVTIQDLHLDITASEQGIVMEFPIYDTEPATASDELLHALGLQAVNNAAFNKETKILLLEITDTEELANLNPDFGALYKSHTSINGVLVTAAAKQGAYDFHSRYFWPWSGTNEDPVTGGTHTFLAKYWAQRLGKSHMRSFQSSARGGFMEVELTDSGLLITGQAHIVLRGELSI